MDRFKMIASVYAFFIKDDKILLLRRYNTGYADGMYGLPSGHVEDNETIADGMCREIKEEVGLDIDKKNISLVHIMHRKEADIRVDFFFVINSWKGNPMNAEPQKCDDLAWFSLTELPQNIVPYVQEAIEHYQNKLLYSERGWE
jgi:ADP-ribose pyrophosphatase YjhB (NUDIX family)